jgi:hypothetical protein
MFQEGDYIVVLKDDAKVNNWQGYIFKQKYQCGEIRPCILMDGKENHSYCYSDFSLPSYWRYATPEEIVEYEKLGKPYLVTDLIPVTKEQSYDYLIPILKRIKC